MTILFSRTQNLRLSAQGLIRLLIHSHIIYIHGCGQQALINRRIRKISAHCKIQNDEKRQMECSSSVDVILNIPGLIKCIVNVPPDLIFIPFYSVHMIITHSRHVERTAVLRMLVVYRPVHGAINGAIVVNMFHNVQLATTRPWNGLYV